MIDCERALELYELVVDARSGTASVDDSLSESELTSVETHVAECPSCRVHLELLAEVSRELGFLPDLRTPRVSLPRGTRRSLPRAGHGSLPLAHKGRASGTRVVAVAALVAIAVSVAVSVASVSFRLARRGGESFFPGELPASLELSGEVADRRRALLAGEPCRLRERVALAWSEDVALRFERGAVFRVRGGQVELFAGGLSASVREGAPFELVTPVARVRVRGTVFHVRVEPRPEGLRPSPELDEESMSSTLKVVPVAAAVSVFVSLGTVVVYNSFGEKEIGADQIARVLESGAPEVVRLPAVVEKLQKELAAANAEIANARTQLASVESTMEKRLAESAASVARAATREDTATGGDPTPPDADFATRMAKVEETFGELKSAGFSVLQSSRLGKLVETIKGLGPEGREFVLDQLASDDKGARFLAAAVIENLKDPQYVPALEASALGDEDFLVRRMSSHALAFLGDPAAGDSLARIVEGEKRDMGVRLNAWYGLAQLERPEAVSSFDRLLNEAGGDVPADFVVDTAMKMTSPVFLPAFRKAYDHPAVSVGIRSRILRTLGDAETGEYIPFLRDVANDEAADANLRETARSVLER